MYSDAVPTAVPAAAEPHPLALDKPHADVPVPCPDCGAEIVERFCGHCGEARPEPGGLRLRHLVGELAEHLTSLDFRVVRTLVTLVRRPGELTRDFVLGRRNRYVRPLALYLLVSGAFFVLMAHFRVSLVSPQKMILREATHPGNGVFTLLASRSGETLAHMATRVSASPLVESRTIAAFLVPVLALLLAALLAGRRRLIAEHVLLAIHLQTFLFLLTYGMNATLYASGWVARRLDRAFGLGWSPRAIDVIAGAVVIAVAAVLVGHAYAALRRVYELPNRGAAWRAVVLTLATPIVLSLTQTVIVVLVAAARW